MRFLSLLRRLPWDPSTTHFSCLTVLVLLAHLAAHARILVPLRVLALLCLVAVRYLWFWPLIVTS